MAAQAVANDTAKIAEKLNKLFHPYLGGKTFKPEGLTQAKFKELKSVYISIASIFRPSEKDGKIKE